MTFTADCRAWSAPCGLRTALRHHSATTIAPWLYPNNAIFVSGAPRRSESVSPPGPFQPCSTELPMLVTAAGYPIGCQNTSCCHCGPTNWARIGTHGSAIAAPTHPGNDVGPVSNGAGTPVPFTVTRTSLVIATSTTDSCQPTWLGRLLPLRLTRWPGRRRTGQDPRCSHW